MAYTPETDEIAKLLMHDGNGKNYSDHVKADKNAFFEWSMGKIDTPACIKKFRKNNCIPDSVHIEPMAFVHWLKEENY